MFIGYEYEDILLEEWGAWVREEGYLPSATSAWSLVDGSGGKGHAPESPKMEKIDRQIAKLALLEKAAIKQWYINGNRCVKASSIKEAVKNFASTRAEYSEKLRIHR